MNKIVLLYVIGLIIFLIAFGYFANKEGLATSRIPCVRSKEEREKPAHKLKWWKK